MGLHLISLAVVNSNRKWIDHLWLHVILLYLARLWNIKVFSSLVNYYSFDSFFFFFLVDTGMLESDQYCKKTRKDIIFYEKNLQFLLTASFKS